MNISTSKILSIFLAFFTLATNTLAQNGNNKLLLRDSLDFKQNQVGVNSNSNEFNPIPYKGGLLFVSNKKSATNPLGFNKVYWVPQSLLANKSNQSDSIKKKFNLNDEFTAPTSNDNNILTRYSRTKQKKTLSSIEQQFADFNPDQSFTINDSNNIVIYPKLAKKKINGIYRWELWEATLQNGRTIMDRKIKILDSAADYLYPNLTNNGTKLYFASNRAGGKGGSDIYFIEKVNGIWQNHPTNIAEINTVANEIYPFAKPDTLLYTSDRVGGIGGYDLYEYIYSQKLNKNLGYPVNTINDDLALSITGNEYFLSSNRLGSIDIIAFQYNPVNIVISGQLIYAKDGQLVPNHSLYIFDKDENKLVDSLKTDANAYYSFNAKPNRNYEATAFNADGVKEIIALKTNDKILQKIDIALNLQGRSPKYIKDSIYYAMVIADKMKEDSIRNALGYNSKYIVYYGFDKSVLNNQEKKTLDALVGKINTNPNAYLIVGAFTDCVGSYKYNYTLSVKRAKYAVDYLRSKGVSKDRFTSNGYSKNYTITPCDPKNKNTKQQINRRAEIVLSEVKGVNWASLENVRGKDYYSNVYSTKNNNLPVTDPNFKMDKTILAKAITAAKPQASKVVSVKVLPTKVDSAKTFVSKSLQNKSSSANINVVDKKVSALAKIIKAEVKSNKVEYKPDAQPEKKVIVANASQYSDDNAKEEILKALDSLATLKKEQERIIEYMTKRINKKPIDVFVSSDSVTIEIYDNGIHDNDSVSIIYNNRIVVDKQELKVRKPITFKLKVDKNKKYNELVMVAENLGSEPPNTAVMFVTEKSGRRQQVMLATDMTHNEVVYFIRIGKE